MIDYTEEQIAARELRNTAYHEAGHKLLYERFGGAGDAVVWKNESGNSEECAWLGQFRPRTCPEEMHKVALKHGFAVPELPANWKMLVGMSGLLAEEILSGETEDTGAMRGFPVPQNFLWRSIGLRSRAHGRHGHRGLRTEL
ncbi:MULTISPECIES: hypothetical protein [Burkholderia]|uniref:Uncharacterized protein n=1 Tax=Burkholderia ambifaria (strain MC40-6) TaxID=398577 RepID=B1Z194_BURA4|nr:MULTISPECIES: hypothetical protein [Burkholderia]ACB67696.1 hypothetical protein BamMC406_5251 [Burkholderia ambifaria MC40-6]QDW52277.1 hypothetical protein FFI87_018250 [Burkholderia sp. KBS0801]